MPGRHFTIPLFIPELACPHRCVFCNQRRIASQLKEVTEDDIREIIESRLLTIPRDGSLIEAGFFGGNFCGISPELQIRYLTAVKPYLENGRIDSIRVSTRPDTITQESLGLLKDFQVRTVELGLQSMDDNILRTSGRGHTAKDTIKAAGQVLSSGMDLGLQMILGLPGDTKEISLSTAKAIGELGASCARIYPALVIRDTELEALYHSGRYTPLSLEEAVEWTAAALEILESYGVNVIRVGLHPSEGLISGESLAAGPFHPAFREIAESLIWKNKFLPLLDRPESKIAHIYMAPEQLHPAVGHKASNKKMLESHFGRVKFTPDDRLSARNFHADIS